MDSLLVTPASEADLQLLTALFKKMKIKAEVLPPARVRPKQKVNPATTLEEFMPQNRGEEVMLEAVLELREVLAGRKEALTMEEFWQRMDED